MLLPSNLRTHVRIAMLNVVERPQNSFVVIPLMFVCLRMTVQRNNLRQVPQVLTLTRRTYRPFLCAVVKISGLE